MEKLKRNFFDWASCLRDSLPRHCWNVIYKLAIVNATHHLSFIFSSSFHLCMSLNATLTSLWQRHWSVIIHCTHQPQHAILQLSKAYSRKWWKVLRLKKTLRQKQKNYLTCTWTSTFESFESSQTSWWITGSKPSELLFDSSLPHTGPSPFPNLAPFAGFTATEPMMTMSTWLVHNADSTDNLTNETAVPWFSAESLELRENI